MCLNSALFLQAVCLHGMQFSSVVSLALFWLFLQKMPPLFWPLEAYKLKSCDDLKKASGDVFSLNKTIRFTETQGLWSSSCTAITVLLPKFLNRRNTAERMVYKIMAESWKQDFLAEKDTSLKGGEDRSPSGTAVPTFGVTVRDRGDKRSWGIPTPQSTPSSALLGDSG